MRDYSRTTHLTRTHLLLLVGITVTMVACSPPSGPEVNGQIVSTGRPIIGGTADTAQAHMAVVALTPGPNWSAFCSGTLITPTVVVTAAHCLEGRSTSDVQVFFGNNIFQSGDYRQVSEVLVHPDYDPQQTTSDIGLLRLASAAPSSVTPIPALPSSNGLSSSDQGATITFAGFGLDEYNNSGVKLTVDGSIGIVCPGPQACSYGSAYVVARAIGYSNSSGPCNGDSGGPAFITRGGQEYLAAVTSYGDQNCSQYGVSTMVQSYESWINNFTGGTSEICGNGLDDDGDGAIDCADSDCSTDTSCQGGDACEDAGTVACGDTITGTTVGGDTTYTMNSCLQSNPEQGPETAYALNIPSGTSFTVNLTPTGSGDLDLFLFPASGSSCDPQSCLDSSTNSGSTAESLSRSMPSGGAFLVVETWDTASTYTLSVTCSGAVEDCTNNVDDDGDGAIDCADSDCTGNAACQTLPEQCANGADDDGDGLADCADPDCSADAACQPGVEQCGNGVDDDGDGAIDCADSDCTTNPACQPGVEQCGNGVDDDGDGAIDCADADCAASPACAPTPEICANNMDDDGDGAIDCADPDCVGSTACTGWEICTNGVDDDGDGVVDCEDPDCVTAPNCAQKNGLTNGGCNCAQGRSGGDAGLPLILGFALLVWIRRRN